MGGGLLIINNMNAARRRRENGNYSGGEGPNMEPKDWLFLFLLMLAIILVTLGIIELVSYYTRGHWI
jgi:hypothetical protein